MITTDGLIATEVPTWVRTNEEALIAFSRHLNSFLALLNIGGIYFSPLSEKEIEHISLKDSTLEQVGGGGDNYSLVTMERAIHRYRIPLLHRTQIIDFPWAMMRIQKSQEVVECHELGEKIARQLKLKNDQLILSFEAYKNYTLHNWNDALLLGWAVIEILIEAIWESQVLTKVTTKEEGRRGRLDDHRTYSASVKSEFLYEKNIIDVDLYNGLNRLRKSRNDLIHDGKVVQENGVSDLFDITSAMVKVQAGIEPKFHNPGWTRSGGWVDANTKSG